MCFFRFFREKDVEKKDASDRSIVRIFIRHGYQGRAKGNFVICLISQLTI